MPLDLVDSEKKTRAAVKSFWSRRQHASRQQRASGSGDRGERSAVTAGKNMQGFHALVRELVRSDGLDSATIQLQSVALTLPGYFRPTKRWDILVIDGQRLVAALEFKSHVGPSFGNNFNNRAEEAIGTAHDFWTAHREGAFGEIPRPFLGWLILVEDADRSRCPVRDRSPHFPVSREFENASYIERYHVLCKRLMLEHLYSAATAMTSPRTAIRNGRFGSFDDMTSLHTFASTLAAHIAAAATRR